MIYSKTQSLASFVNESAVLKESFEWMIQWFIQIQSLASFVNESAVLKESFEWMIQWFIQIQSLASFVNESAVLKNRLSEWFNDFFKNTVICFICKWISYFEGIVWVNDSMIYSKTQSLASFVNESAVLKNRLSEWFNELFKNTVTCFICKWISYFEGIVWVNDSMIYSKTQSLASFVNESAVLKNRLSEWFNYLLKNGHLLHL